MAAAPGVDPVSFIIGLDQLVRAAAPEIAGVEERRVLRIRVVLRVEAVVADDKVRPPIAVEIGRGDRGPPPGSGGGEARSFSPILETRAVVVVEIPDLAPVQRED